MKSLCTFLPPYDLVAANYVWRLSCFYCSADLCQFIINKTADLDSFGCGSEYSIPITQLSFQLYSHYLFLNHHQASSVNAKGYDWCLLSPLRRVIMISELPLLSYTISKGCQRIIARYCNLIFSGYKWCPDCDGRQISCCR